MCTTKLVSMSIRLSSFDPINYIYWIERGQTRIYIFWEKISTQRFYEYSDDALLRAGLAFVLGDENFHNIQIFIDFLFLSSKGRIIQSNHTVTFIQQAAS